VAGAAPPVRTGGVISTAVEAVNLHDDTIEVTVGVYAHSRLGIGGVPRRGARTARGAFTTPAAPFGTADVAGCSMPMAQFWTCAVRATDSAANYDQFRHEQRLRRRRGGISKGDPGGAQLEHRRA